MRHRQPTGNDSNGQAHRCAASDQACRTAACQSAARASCADSSACQAAAGSVPLHRFRRQRARFGSIRQKPALRAALGFGFPNTQQCLHLGGGFLRALRRPGTLQPLARKTAAGRTGSSAFAQQSHPLPEIGSGAHRTNRPHQLPLANLIHSICRAAHARPQHGVWHCRCSGWNHRKTDRHRKPAGTGPCHARRGTAIRRAERPIAAA